MEFTDDDLEIERRVGDLIDRGLARYEAGDMEGALAQWKHALALDPDSERAANYLEYVEEHHDLGGGDGGSMGESTVELAYPFGVSSLGLAKLTEQELDDYESFEIVDTGATARPAKRPPTVEELDDGWSVDEGWVQDLVANSDVAFTPSPPADAGDDAAESDFATLDIDQSSSNDDDERSTRVHRSSDKIRSLAGFDDLELDDDAPGDDDDAPGDDDDARGDDDDAPGDYEEEMTQARLDSLPRRSTRRASSVEAETLEIDLDDVEENTKFHESARRVGASHTAASNAFADLDLGGLGDIGLGPGLPAASKPKPPLLPDVADAIDAMDDTGATIDFHSRPTLELDELEDSSEDLEHTNDLDIGLSGSGLPDLARTRSQFGMDDELTIDRSELVNRRPQSRAPTHDNNISSSSISVDDALLSLQDSTRELDLRDMGLALPGAKRSSADASDGLEPEVSGGTRERETKKFPKPIAVAESGEGGLLSQILGEAPDGDEGERTLYIVNRLIELGGDEFTDGRGAEAAKAICDALDYASDSAVAQKVVFENERTLIQILISSLGDASQTPRLVCALTEIPGEHINHRAAFLLTRLDQSMTLEELLDVSGMPRLEALRHLCGLHVLNYLEVV